MQVMEAIKARKSIRAFTDQEVEQEKLMQVLEAGRLAPSASNQQRWKFIVVKDETLRAGMVEACANQKFVGQAPVILVICADEVKDMRCKQPARTIDCSIALSFMMLEAAELGLGTCWIGAFYEEKVRELLQIPEAYDIVAVTPLGYPDTQGNHRIRKEMEDIVVYDTWK